MSAPRAVGRYLVTEYLYHWKCIRCGAVQHRRAGVSPDTCTCGCDSWSGRMARAGSPEPWYIQTLDPECRTCRKTLAEVLALTAQMELFDDSTDVVSG